MGTFKISTLADGVWNYHILQNNILVRSISHKNKKIADHIICDLQLDQEWIYCIGTDKGINKIIRLDKDNGVKEVLSEAAVNSFQLVNGWLYYSNAENSNLLYRTKSDGTETMKILRDGNLTPKSWFVQNGFIYYQDLRSRLICRARIDGSETTVLSNVYGVSNASNNSLLAQTQVVLSFRVTTMIFCFVLKRTPVQDGLSFARGLQASDCRGRSN